MSDIFDPETVKSYFPIDYCEMPGTMVTEEDFDKLLECSEREQVFAERLKLERDELRAMVHRLLDSAHPNERYHPRMFPAWQAGRALLEKK